MTPCPTLMVQGTASSVGKSLLVAGLCRHYRNRGLRVAPFKSQNMALNSAVTPEGLEIGRAQAVQAAAAGIAPHVDMNPVLLKPEGVHGCQVVVAGKPFARVPADALHPRSLAPVVRDALGRLRSSHDVVLIEGAGSPAEINLSERDIANMFVAQMADAPVVLVGDIDRGGVFASLVGTLALLAPGDRARVAGLVINKFRGDLESLRPGLSMLQQRVERPVLGVLPFLPDLGIADEDSVSIEARGESAAADGRLDVAVLRVPHLSNTDDLLALDNEPGVAVRYVRHVAALGAPDGPDLVVVPGSKSTIADLSWLRQAGFDAWLQQRARMQAPIFGICGGYQMLGRSVSDEGVAEGAGGQAQGLGLLPCTTRFGAEKVTRRVVAVPRASWLTAGAQPTIEAPGYEIHMGVVTVDPAAPPLLDVDGCAEGCQSSDGTVMGTLVHGLLDSDALRHALLRGLASRRGLEEPPLARLSVQDAYDRLAAAVAEHLDMQAFDRLLGV